MRQEVWGTVELRPRKSYGTFGMVKNLPYPSIPSPDAINSVGYTVPAPQKLGVRISAPPLPPKIDALDTCEPGIRSWLFC